MKIIKLNNGTLLVPRTVKSDNMIGDRYEEIEVNHKDYKKYLKHYQKEQKNAKQYLHYRLKK